jgi:hypothetical protein
VPRRLACTQAADGHRFRSGWKHVDFRMAGDETAARLLHRRPIEFAKTAAECNKVFDRQLLAPKEDDEMIEPRAVYLVEVLVAPVPQVDGLNFRCWRCVGRNNRQGNLPIATIDCETVGPVNSHKPENSETPQYRLPLTSLIR